MLFRSPSIFLCSSSLPFCSFHSLLSLLPVPTLSHRLLSLPLASFDVFLPSLLYFLPLPTLLSCLSPLSLLPPSPPFPTRPLSIFLSAFAFPLLTHFSSWLTHKMSTRTPKCHCVLCGEGGNPLQCSFLENLMDREIWRLQSMVS